MKEDEEDGGKKELEIGSFSNYPFRFKSVFIIFHLRSSV